MKRFVKVSVVMFLMALVQSAHGAILDGPSSSGGGAALVCRTSAGQIGYSQVLDLYEAQTVFGLQLIRASGSVAADYLWAAANTYRLQGHPELAESEQDSIAEGLQRFFSIVHLTDPGTKLTPLNDLGETPPLPAGCAIEQLAIFHDEAPQYVEIDSEIWNSLDSVNRAALASHEAYYAWERTLRERTSKSTRSFVGHIYAANGVVPVLAGVPAQSRACLSEDPRFNEITSTGSDSISYANSHISTFRTFPMMTSQGMGTRLQFESLAGWPEVTKAFIDVPGANFAVQYKVDQATSSLVAVVAEPGKNIHVELPVRGGLRYGV